jgi:hypothetical protein
MIAVEDEGNSMVALRTGAFLLAMTVAAPVVAEELRPEQARRFVTGKLFAFSCFEGSRGAGRIHADGSVAGSVQMRGAGPVRFASLPAGTLQVKGDKVCASVKGMPFEPCFNVVQTSSHSFRGSISGFGFAYCDFTRRGHGRERLVRTAAESRQRAKPMALRSSITQ